MTALLCMREVKESWLTGCVASDRNIPQSSHLIDWFSAFLLRLSCFCENKTTKKKIFQPVRIAPNWNIKKDYKISFFFLSLSLNSPLNRSIDCDRIEAYLFVYARKRRIYCSHQTHDLPRKKNTTKSRETKRKFQEWLRAEKAGNKFLNAQVATTFCYCSFYFLPSLPLKSLVWKWKCARLARTNTRRKTEKKKKKATKECWARFFEALSLNDDE